MNTVLKNFAYQNVTLTDSHWKRQRDELIDTYLKLDNDDLLHYFRTLAGLPAPRNGLAGWYGRNACTFGQKLGALARLYLATGDERIRQKAQALSDGWGECAAASEKVIDVNDTYVYDKVMGGFLDMYEYLGDKKALGYISRLTDSAMKRFRRNISRDGLQDEILGPDMIEWYTLPEQLYRAYRFTGEEKYLAFAREWDYPYYWEKLVKKDFASIGPRHAYSHVNCLSSAASAWLETGEEQYLTAIKNAYEEILAHHSFATGGYGPAECLFAQEEGYLGDSLRANWDKEKLHPQYRDFSGNMRTRDDMWGSCEVSCCSWAVFKLCDYLLRITGDARYGDWAEKLLYNGCGGQLPITEDGRVMYYADYFLNGGFKSVEDGRMHEDGANFEWQCCTGTFPEDVAEYSNMLYYQEENGLAVSQYLASRVRFAVNGSAYTLENTSFYPKEKALRFVLHQEAGTDKPESFRLRFRVPSWATGRNRVTVNGLAAEEPMEPNTWLTLERAWKDGDEIIISFEFTLRFESVDDKSPEVEALCYGPLVMVCDRMTLFEGDRSDPGSWMEPIQKDGYSFAFRTKPGHVKPYAHLTREFYPYYEVPGMEWYYMYVRVE